MSRVRRQERAPGLGFHEHARTHHGHDSRDEHADAPTCGLLLTRRELPLRGKAFRCRPYRSSCRGPSRRCSRGGHWHRRWSRSRMGSRCRSRSLRHSSLGSLRRPRDRYSDGPRRRPARPAGHARKAHAQRDLLGRTCRSSSISACRGCLRNRRLCRLCCNRLRLRGRGCWASRSYRGSRRSMRTSAAHRNRSSDRRPGLAARNARQALAQCNRFLRNRCSWSRRRRGRCGRGGIGQRGRRRGCLRRSRAGGRSRDGRRIRSDGRARWRPARATWDARQAAAQRESWNRHCSSSLKPCGP